MNPAISKSRAVMAGALALVAGFIIYSETKGGQSADTERGAKRERGAARGDASNRPKVAKGCPGEQTVEDPSIKVSPDFIKNRFSTNICSRIPTGEINACRDPDEAACKKRLDGISRMLKNPGDCINRPAEMYCSVLQLADDSASTMCFETKQVCEAFRERKKGQSKICRIAPACELVTLPPV